MEELRAITLQYINCANPTESAARKLRVQQIDEQGLMEETSRSIIETAVQTQALAIQQIAEATSPTNVNQYALSPAQTTRTTIEARRRGRPAKQRDMRISPKTNVGSNSRKRNLEAIQASPGPSTANQRGAKIPQTTAARRSRTRLEQISSLHHYPRYHLRRTTRPHRAHHWIFTGAILLFLSCTQLELLWDGESYNSPAN